MQIRFHLHVRVIGQTDMKLDSLSFRVVKSSWLPVKITACLVSIGRLLCLPFLYRWPFLKRTPGLAALILWQLSRLLQNFLTTCSFLTLQSLNLGVIWCSVFCNIHPPVALFPTLLEANTFRRRTLGGAQYCNLVWQKLANLNSEIPHWKTTKYWYCISDYAPAINLSHCEKTWEDDKLISTMIKKHFLPISS